MFCMALHDLRLHMITCTAALVSCCEDFQQGEQVLHEVLDEIDRRDAAVQGNRHDNTPLTWKDAQLVMRNALAVLLERLERET